MVKYFIFVLILSAPSFFNAQNDSVSLAKTIRPYITPSLLIGSGLYINATSSSFSKQTLQQKLTGNFSGFSTNVDDYLPFVPIGQIYLGKALGLKSKNSYFNQTKNIFLSQFFTALITQSIKRTTQVTRPDGTLHSFPSGHSSVAFSSASTLFYEYKENHPFYAASGFLFASATGGLRVLNNRHWVSDVLVGAGIGLLTTHLIYHFEPLKNWNPFKRKNKNTSQLLFD